MGAALDPQAFRQTMGLFPTGVTVVAADTGDGIHAMTANAVSSVSLEPLLVLVCVARQAHMAELLMRATGFSINFLREDQQALSSYFAGGWSEKPAPPFRFVPWEGGPRLEGALAALGCRLSETVPGGDHQIVIGEVVALHRGVEPLWPLIFFTGRYGKMSPTRPTPAPDLDRVQLPVQVYYDPWRADEP